MKNNTMSATALQAVTVNITSIYSVQLKATLYSLTAESYTARKDKSGRLRWYLSDPAYLGLRLTVIDDAINLVASPFMELVKQLVEGSEAPDYPNRFLYLIESGQPVTPDALPA